MQMTENNFMAFLDWKPASVPVQRCNQVSRANIGEWGRGQGTAQEGETYEVILDPRTLQNQLKRAETAPEQGHVGTPQYHTEPPI